MINKAVFLDRDGVINSDEGHYYIFKPEDVKLNPGVIAGCQLLQKHNYLLIIITNQGGIAKGKYTKADAESVHNCILEQFNAAQITISEIYYCPHHSDLEKCLCRKPGNLNIEKALARFKIDRTQSWFIGDNQTDIQAGKASGLRTIKVDANSNLLPFCQQIINTM